VSRLPVEFLHQDDVTFLHLHSQQIQSFPSVELPDALSVNMRLAFTPPL
jgi:hypothetical protein